MYISISRRSPGAALNRIRWNAPICAAALLVLWIDGWKSSPFALAVPLALALRSFMVCVLHLPVWLALRRAPPPSDESIIEAAFDAQVLKQPSLAGARLVKKTDAGGGDFPLETHRIYCTPSGRYFLFICTAGQGGHLSFLTSEGAENALRSSPEIFRREFGRDRGI